MYIHKTHIQRLNAEYTKLYLKWWFDDKMQFGALSIDEQQYIANYRTNGMNTDIYPLLSNDIEGECCDDPICELPANYYYSLHIDTRNNANNANNTL